MASSSILSTERVQPRLHTPRTFNAQRRLQFSATASPNPARLQAARQFGNSLNPDDITRETNRKYTWKKSQVCQTILAISNSLRHHTCDCYLRFFRVYLRFVSYLRYIFLNHTCDLNRKYAEQNRKYGAQI